MIHPLTPTPAMNLLVEDQPFDPAEAQDWANDLRHEPFGNLSEEWDAICKGEFSTPEYAAGLKAALEAKGATAILDDGFVGYPWKPLRESIRSGS